MVGRRRLVHTIGARRVQGGQTLRHALVGKQHRLLDERGRSGALARDERLRRTVLAHERMHLDGVEVDGAAREANCCALLGELVRQGEKRGKVHALGRSAGNLLRQRQAAVRARRLRAVCSGAPVRSGVPVRSGALARLVVPVRSGALQQRICLVVGQTDARANDTRIHAHATRMPRAVELHINRER